jgi:adenylate cyclase
MCAQHPEISLPLALGAGALARMGERSRAIEWCAQALAIAPDDPLTLFNVACGYGLLGEIDPALELLERWRPRANPRGRTWIRVDSDFDALRTNPRFQEFLSRLD